MGPMADAVPSMAVCLGWRALCCATVVTFELAGDLLPRVHPTLDVTRRGQAGTLRRLHRHRGTLAKRTVEQQLLYGRGPQDSPHFCPHFTGGLLALLSIDSHCCAPRARLLRQTGRAIAFARSRFVSMLATSISTHWNHEIKMRG